MQIPTTFTVYPDSQIGDVYGTEFTFTSNISSVYNSFVWNFGDGVTSYNKSPVTHTYNYPGLYTVGLSAWNEFGEIYTDKATINVDYVYPDALTFKSIPDTYGIPGLPSNVPFVVSLTSSKIDQPLSLVLQALNSKSVPYYAVPKKWRSITPKWRFTDASGRVLEDNLLVLSSVPIYKNSKVVAVKAESSFYFIDDMSSGMDPVVDCPLIIITTLSTEQFTYPPETLIYPYASYSNSETARAAVAWQVNDVTPTSLRVTENVLNDIYPVKWSNVPIPVMVTCETDLSYLAGISNSTTMDLSYPKTNDIGAAHPVILSLSSDSVPLINGVHYKIEEPLSYFKATDEYNNVASGYVFTTITPLTSIATGTVVVSVSTVVSNKAITETNPFVFPVGYPIYPNVYIAHPVKNVINRISATTYSANCSNIQYYKNLGTLIEGSVSFISTPPLISTDITNYTLSGTSGIYAMAVNPTLNRLYTADVDQNILSVYDSGTTLLTSVQLSSFVKKETLAPSCITIDGNNNVWVSLMDAFLLLKFDSDLNYLMQVKPGVSHMSMDNAEDPGDILQETTEYILLDDASEFILAETDMNNDVWICYDDNSKSMLAKHSSSGDLLFTVDGFPFDSFPVCLAIDNQNGIWIACKGTNNLLNYSTVGKVTANVADVLHPSYIAVDRLNNVWIAHGHDLCSVLNPTTQTLKTWKISTTERTITKSELYFPENIEQQYLEDEIWGGMTIDVFDRVWLIDSVNNKTIVFSTATPENFFIYDILPQSNTDYMILTNDTFVTNITSNNIRSAQAGGDWSGNRWYQKYSENINTKPIYGVSAPFKLYDLNSSFQLAKVNEDFNCAEYYMNLALPEVLNNNPGLSGFFDAIVGDGNTNNESTGRVVYERIANFVSNRGDFETAEIDELQSLAASMAVDVKTFGDKFPVAINRLLSIFSVPKHQLRGVPNLENNVENNIGHLLTETDLVTANKYYFIKDKKYNTHQILYANTFNLSSTYPINSVDAGGLRRPIFDNYHVFTYNEQNSTGYTGNLIDWDSVYTHLGQTNSYSLSTNEEWYGDNGIVETMFNNLLTKQLYQQ